MKTLQKQMIYIPIPDMERLRRLLEDTADHRATVDRNLRSLEDELDRAELVDADYVPKNLVRMNSWIRLQDLDTEEEMFFQLVYPPHADISAAKISVLAPIGTAILGYRAGDVVEWQVPRGVKRLRIDEVVDVQ
jgi:regulator of nucleoside diphosphate kinase